MNEEVNILLYTSNIILQQTKQNIIQICNYNNHDNNYYLR